MRVVQTAWELSHLFRRCPPMPRTAAVRQFGVKFQVDPLDRLPRYEGLKRVTLKIAAVFVSFFEIYLLCKRVSVEYTKAFKRPCPPPKIKGTRFNYGM